MRKREVDIKKLKMAGHSDEVIARHYKRFDCINLLTQTNVDIYTASVFMALIDEVFGMGIQGAPHD